MEFCNCSMFCCALLCVHSSFGNHLDGEECAGCFALFVFLVSHDCCFVIPHDATGLSAICDCGYFLIILTYYFYAKYHIW